MKTKLIFTLAFLLTLGFSSNAFAFFDYDKDSDYNSSACTWFKGTWKVHNSGIGTKMLSERDQLLATRVDSRNYFTCDLIKTGADGTELPFKMYFWFRSGQMMASINQMWYPTWAMREDAWDRMKSSLQMKGARLGKAIYWTGDKQFTIYAQKLLDKTRKTKNFRHGTEAFYVRNTIIPPPPCVKGTCEGSK